MTCGRLRPPKDGRVFFSSTSFGAEASYECIPGFKLVGVEVRTCQANGEWSEEEPSCQSEWLNIIIGIYTTVYFTWITPSEMRAPL